MVVEPDFLDTDAAGAAAIRGGLVRVISFAAGSILSVLSIALLFRHLGPADSGRYVTILALVAIAGGVTDAGLVGIGVRELAQSEGDERALVMRRLLGLRIVLTSAGIAAAVIFALAAGYDGRMVAGTVAAGVAFLVLALQSAYSVGLQAQLRLGTVAAADLTRQAVSLAAVVALVALGGSLLAFLAANIPAALAALAVTVVAVRRMMPLGPIFDVHRWGGLLRDTVPYAVATAVAAIYFRVAVILVSLISSPAQAGYFGASFRGVEFLIVIPQLLVSSAFPIFSRAARDDRERLAGAVGRVFTVCLLLGLAVGVLLVVGAPFIIDVVAGARFGPADAVLRVHGLGLVASFAGATWGYTALSLREHRAILVSSLVSLAVSATLVSVLASSYGALGAAIGTAIAETVFAAALAVTVHRAGVSPGIRPGAAAGALAVAGIAAGLGLAMTQRWSVPPVVATAVALAIYGGGVAALGLVPPEATAVVRSRLGSQPT